MKASDIILLILEAGEIMLTNGAETYRVEETMERIGKACKVPQTEAFVTPTGIFLSITDSRGETLTKVRRVRTINTNLAMVTRVNDISRRLWAGTIWPEQALELLRSIRNLRPEYDGRTRTAAAGVGSASFAILFGGGLADILPAFLGGVIVNFMVQQISKLPWTRFISVFVGGAVAALIGMASGALFPLVMADKVIVGNIMILVPGVALTNAIRDVMSGELLAGGSRALEALMTAVSTAVGVALSLSVWKAVAGV